MKETIVSYPAAALGNLVSMVELAKLIFQHHSHYSITILVTSMPRDVPATSSYITQITTTLNLPSLSFHFLPTPNLPPLSNCSKTQSPIAMVFEFYRLNVPNVRHALTDISLTSSVPALITSAVHGSTYHPDIPTYYYFTSCASTLAAFLYLPTLHGQTTKSFKDLAWNLFHIPGLPPIQGSDFPDPVLDRDDQGSYQFLNFGASLPKSRGIIANTFGALEPRAIRAIIEGYCTPNCVIPPLHSIGPITKKAGDRVGISASERPADCLAWLDGQPTKSVVFLCFGRRGTFAAAQLREIAFGLERSQQRFLWVVKSPPTAATRDEPDLDSLLPEGFAERTKERGLVVKSWAPQATVLNHGSVGGFVTHCGWNSAVEAVSAGVPMVAWPLYAEQRMNSVVLVEEMKVAIGVDGSVEGWVRAEEVERRVRELMFAAELRNRIADTRDAATAAWRSGGSSLADFSNLVGSWSSKCQGEYIHGQF